MPTVRSFRNRIFAAAIFVVVLASAPQPAHAVSKEIIELQTQVQQLLDMMQRLQSTVDTRFGVMQHLSDQNADNSNQVTAAMNALQQKMNAQGDAAAGKLDAVSGQMQSMNDSVDELKSRITKLNKAVEDLQAQLQNIQNSAGPAPAPAPSGHGNSARSVPPAPSPALGESAAGQAPPLHETFQAGVRDYNSAKYEVAAGEFQDVIHYYPLDDIAGQAHFYLGEIAYRHQDYPAAIKAYNAVLEGFSGSSKAPAAQLRKGLSLLQMNKKESGVHELRLLIQRYPQSPEAAQARTKLNGLGVRVATPTR